MKKVLATILIALTVVCGVYAVDFTLGVQTGSNGFILHANEDELPKFDMHLKLDASLGMFAKNGLGGYLSAGYILDYIDVPVFDDSITHGISADLGFAFKKSISRSTEFMLSTGFGIEYRILDHAPVTMDYNVGLDFLFNIGSKGYIKLGTGYQLKFLSINKVGDETKSETYVDHNLMLPTVGFGIRF